MHEQSEREPIVGFRSWELRGDGQLVPRLDLHPGPSVGGAELTASYSAEGEILQAEFARSWRIVGAIKASRVLSSAQGFRCAEAEVVALARSPNWSEGELEAAKRAARDHGVQLVEVERLADVASEYGRPALEELRPPPGPLPAPVEAADTSGARLAAGASQEAGAGPTAGRASQAPASAHSPKAASRGSPMWLRVVTILAGVVVPIAGSALLTRTPYEDDLAFAGLLTAGAAAAITRYAPGDPRRLGEVAAIVGGASGALYGVSTVFAGASEAMLFALLVVAALMLATGFACAVNAAARLTLDAVKLERLAALAGITLPVAAAGGAVALLPSAALVCVVIGIVEFGSLRAWRRATEGRVRRPAN